MGWALLGLVVSVYGLFVLGLPVYLWLQAKRLARIEARLVELEIGLEEARVDRFEARAATPPVVRGREEESPIVGDPETPETGRIFRRGNTGFNHSENRSMLWLNRSTTPTTGSFERDSAAA